MRSLDHLIFPYLFFQTLFLIFLLILPTIWSTISEKQFISVSILPSEVLGLSTCFFLYWAYSHISNLGSIIISSQNRSTPFYIFHCRTSSVLWVTLLFCSQGAHLPALFILEASIFLIASLN